MVFFQVDFFSKESEAKQVSQEIWSVIAGQNSKDWGRSVHHKRVGLRRHSIPKRYLRSVNFQNISTFLINFLQLSAHSLISTYSQPLQTNFTMTRFAVASLFTIACAGVAMGGILLPRIENKQLLRDCPDGPVGNGEF